MRGTGRRRRWQAAAAAGTGRGGGRADVRRGGRRGAVRGRPAVLARLDAHAARVQGSPAGAETDTDTGAGAPLLAHPDALNALDALDALSALGTLAACFGLTPFEQEVVLLTAAAELDPTTGVRCAAACGDPARPYPTFSLALAALGDPTGAPSPRSPRCAAGSWSSWTTRPI
ncbi:hypothetical protein O1L44_12525 [Streptomyces noursei]|nr:hypothetical protein [Streptomyces noursei]